MLTKKRDPEYVRRFELAEKTAKWAVTMTQVAIRQAIAKKPWPHWHLLTFTGPDKRESRGVVDLVAIRKDHGKPIAGTKRGDALQIILIQVKGGSAAKPTAEDAARIRIVADHHRACGVLYAAWKKGSAAQFYSLDERLSEWSEMKSLLKVFG